MNMKIIAKLLSFLILLSMIGCVSVHQLGENSYMTDPTSEYGVSNIPEETCRKRGKNPIINNMTGDWFNGYVVLFSCDGTDSQSNSQGPIQKTPTSTKTTISLEEASVKCKELGFTPQSEKFGQCVLQLTR